MRAKVLRWTAVGAWASVIFALSSIPGSDVPGRFGTEAHFLEYAVLGSLLYLALRLHAGTTTALIAAVLIASAYGITDELHQAFVPMRVPDPVDWVVDTLGAAFGATMAWLGYDKLRRARQ
jgi:VanZ family protein